MPACFLLNGETEQTRPRQFPDSDFTNLVLKLQGDPAVNYMSIISPQAGIIPTIRQLMVDKGAKEYVCFFSNKVRPDERLTIIYR
jgi:hypothetical protein